MDTILTGIAGLSLMIWAGLTGVWGGGWWLCRVRLPQRQTPSEAQSLGAAPAVVVVIPARNEAAQIAQVLRAHGASTYPGPLTVILVDDDSTDGTADIAREVAAHGARPIHVIPGRPLPPGWTGKMWAVETGLAAADRLAPDAPWVLLTDADILHRPDTLTRLVAKGEEPRKGAEQGLSLVSLMAKLDCRGLWGWLLIPPFIFYFQKLYPFPWVNHPRLPLAGAAGGCMLVRRQALREIGGMGALKGALIDDCTFAAILKQGPPRRQTWLGLSTGEVVSLRDNRAFTSVWSMVRRTAFSQLRHSTALLVLCLLGLGLTYLAAPLLVVTWPWHGDPWAAGLAAGAWALMCVAYLPTLRLYGLPWLWTLSLPVATTLYGAMTCASAVAHWRGRGGLWKGRTAP